MNQDLLLPVIATTAWLIVALSALASYRLRWSAMLKLALVWVAIFGGIFLIVQWFLWTRDTTSGLL